MRSRRCQGDLVWSYALKLFISWSGSLSEEVALAFKEWLPPVLQNAKPWMSSTDIPRGSAWYNEIKRSLADTDTGLLFVTRENQHAEWLLFEAGALGKGLDTSRICTILVNCEPTEVAGPLGLFQGTRLTRSDIGKLLQDLNKAMPASLSVEPKALDRAIDRSWADLESEVNRLIAKHSEVESAKPEPAEMDLLKEILQTVRDLRVPRHSGPDTEVTRALADALVSTSGKGIDNWYKNSGMEFDEVVREIVRRGRDIKRTARGIFPPDSSLPAGPPVETQP